MTSPMQHTDLKSVPDSLDSDELQMVHPPPPGPSARADDRPLRQGRRNQP